jgi:RNA polymerase sigma-54 factor
MAMYQGLQQKLLQKLSPQQIQLMKLLQIPSANIEERIKEELEENPALEVSDDETVVDEYAKDEFTAENEEEYNTEGSEEEYDNVDISEYVNEGDDDVADYKLRDENYGEQEEERTTPHRVEVSFMEQMLQQLGELNLAEKEQKIAEQIIGSLDDDGYLRREINALIDDLAFRQNIEATEKEVKAVLKTIQEFEPAGVAATSLQECLILQLLRVKEEVPQAKVAINILQKYFEEFSKKHYEKIQKGLNLTDNELKEYIHLIIKLNPKPGSNTSAGESNVNYVIPDFFVVNNLGKLELTLNSRNAPDLRISGDYRDMLRDYEKSSKKDKQQKEAVLFIKQKLDSAKWFIDAIKQRQATLHNTMDAIMDYQQAFFISGDETDLRPMILKDIAERTNLDISTVSRVANEKFVQTEFGTFRLKFFFSESLQTESGEEVSTKEVKKILQDIVDEESKKNPLSDEILTEMLQQKGYNIARRTVAKYREQLNIPVARLRKTL